MPSNRKRVLSLVGLASALCAAYVVYARLTTKGAVHEANKDVDAAIAVSVKAQAKSREVGALLNEAAFKNDRAKLTSEAREASQLFGESDKTFKVAANKLHVAIDASDTDEGRAYYTLKRDSLLKLADVSNAAQEGYTIMTDESIADLPTLFAKIEPTAVRAEKAKVEADRLTARRMRIGSSTEGSSEPLTRRSEPCRLARRRCRASRPHSDKCSESAFGLDSWKAREPLLVG